MSIQSVMPSNHLILCHPLLLLPSIFPSIRVFSNESVLPILWPKYWSFSLSNSPSNEYSGLISFRMDWFDFLAVQGTLKGLLQLHSLNCCIGLVLCWVGQKVQRCYGKIGKNVLVNPIVKFDWVLNSHITPHHLIHWLTVRLLKNVGHSSSCVSKD